MPHTIRPEPLMDQAIAESGTRGLANGPDKAFRFAADMVKRAAAPGSLMTILGAQVDVVVEERCENVSTVNGDLGAAGAAFGLEAVGLAAHGGDVAHEQLERRVRQRERDEVGRYVAAAQAEREVAGRLKVRAARLVRLGDAHVVAAEDEPNAVVDLAVRLPVELPHQAASFG